LRTIVIIQARLGSTRLPGKVLLPLGEQTILYNVVERAQAIQGIQEVVLATTTQREDDLLVEEAHRCNIPVYRGSASNVLQRYYDTAVAHRADHIIRITSDCPLIDPALSSLALSQYFEKKVDCAHLVKYPRGLDTEIFSFNVLERCMNNASIPYHFEHVTPYIYENKAFFNIYELVSEPDTSHYRWTVDTLEDYKAVQAIYSYLPKDTPKAWSWKETLQIVRDHPDISLINENIRQKELGE